MQTEFFCHELELIERLNLLRIEHPALKLFGLIDGTVDNPGLEQFFLLAPEADYEPLFLETEFAACLPHSPYLFAIDAADEAFLQQWGCWAEHQITWWLSSWPLDQQARHWRSLIQVLTIDLDTTLFRFWDSQVLSPIVRQCTPAERLLLLAPCHTFIAPHPSRQWWIWQNPSPDIPLTEKEAPWWQMQAHHLQDFASSFERLLVDEIEDHLWRTEPTHLSRIYPPHLPLLIQQGTGQARALGLQHEQAMRSFVQCQIRFGPHYWQDESLAPLWRQADQRDSRFLAWSQQALAVHTEHRA